MARSPVSRRLLRKEVIGVVVLVLAVAISYLAIARPDPFSDPQRARIMLDSASGISIIQREVRIAGVNVGTIGQVRRVGDDAEVELLFDEPVGTIYADAYASLRPHTPFEGTAYVDLDPGTPTAPPLGDRTLPKSRTSVYVSLDEAQRLFKRPNRERISRIAPELARSSDDGGVRETRKFLKTAPSLMRDSGQAARALRGRRGTELRAAIRNVGTTVDAVVGPGPRLQRAVTDLRATAAAFAVDDGRALDATLARLPATLKAIPKASRSADEALAGVVRVSKALEPALPEFGRTLRATDPVLERVTQELPRTTSVIRDIDSSLDNVVVSAPTIRNVLLTFGRITEVGNGTLLPSLYKPTSLGLPTYLQLLAGFTATTGMLSPFQTREQSPSGWGHALRGTLDVGHPEQGPEKKVP